MWDSGETPCLSEALEWYLLPMLWAEHDADGQTTAETVCTRNEHRGVRLVCRHGLPVLCMGIKALQDIQILGYW
jgi:hypothetical protein